MDIHSSLIRECATFDRRNSPSPIIPPSHWVKKSRDGFPASDWRSAATCGFSTASRIRSLEAGESPWKLLQRSARVTHSQKRSRRLSIRLTLERVRGVEGRVTHLFSCSPPLLPLLLLLHKCLYSPALLFTARVGAVRAQPVCPRGTETGPTECYRLLRRAAAGNKWPLSRASAPSQAAGGLC